ncbi:ABA4-like family protein [Maribacter sp. X9]|uniref:ABA4-like family protein n=1 Tax=Maribacter sp. X9 TaxID=3402159 RepID=UPI003AF3F86F
MTPTTIFSLANMLALPMWILMIFLPKWKVSQFMMSYKIIPILLALIYVVYITKALYTGGMMDFRTLDSVVTLFKNDIAVLAGWVHYLAFDLLVGMWLLEQNKKVGLHQILMGICLLGTFMFGPLGFLLFMILKTFKTRPNVSA